jgi:hypothetical protein
VKRLTRARTSPAEKSVCLAVDAIAAGLVPFNVQNVGGNCQVAFGPFISGREAAMRRESWPDASCRATPNGGLAASTFERVRKIIINGLTG